MRPDPTIGVVVPVYRVEPFVAAAVEAIAAQTRRPAQVVLIDDRGGDESMTVACRAAEKAGLDVEVLTQPRNLGLAAARNRGLAHLRTDLVWFLDSDDLAAPDFLDQLTRALVDQDADFAMSRVTRVTAQGEPIDVVEPSWSPRVELTGTQFAHSLLSGNVRGYACNKLFRRSLLGEAPFPEGVAYEDIGPALQYGLRARTVALVDDPLYRYRDNAGSISRTFGPHTRDLFGVALLVERIVSEQRGLGPQAEKSWADPWLRFRYDTVILPAANMATRSLDVTIDDDPTLRREAQDVIDLARRQIRARDLWRLARIGARRQALAGAVLASSPATYRRVLRHR